MRKTYVSWSTAFVFALSFLLYPCLTQADYHIKKIKHTDEVTIMGQTQPAKDEQGETWLSKDKMRQDEGQSRTTIVRLDQDKIYVVDHEKKSYSVMDLPIDFEKELSPQAKQMMQMMQVTPKVTATEETQKIKDWDCRKYIVEIDVSMMGMNMPMKMEMWLTKDIDIDMDMYKDLSTKILSINPMFKGFAQEFEKLDGYPVVTLFSMTMMGAETKYREEVLSVEEADAPEGTYELPEGYSETAFNPFQQRTK
ncbi:MAG: DUF4412 domain-containing protein [Candidatus Aminicenantes bacterium]